MPNFLKTFVVNLLLLNFKCNHFRESLCAAVVLIKCCTLNIHNIVDWCILDTIPGRQCMASCFFLLKQFEDVLIYLNSIRVMPVSCPVLIFHCQILVYGVDWL